MIAVVLYLIYTYPIQSLIVFLTIVSIIVLYYLYKHGTLSDISSAFSKKGNFDLVVYEYIIWSLLPAVFMYILGLDFSRYFALGVSTSILFFLFLSPIFAYIGTFTRSIVLIREGKIRKNSTGLFALEWIIWAIAIPLLIIGSFTSYNVLSGYSLVETWITYKSLLGRFIVGSIFFMWFIIGPIFANISVLTRPKFKINVTKENLEKERKEIVDMIHEVTRR